MSTISSTMLLIAFLLVFAACSPDSKQQQDLPPFSGPEQLTLGKQLYALHCASCHGTLAKGGIAGPDLTVSSFRYGKERAAVVKSILEGRAGGMPSFGAHLKPEQAAYLTDFLLQLH